MEEENRQDRFTSLHLDSDVHLSDQKKKSGEHLLSACLALCWAPDGWQTTVLEVLPQRAQRAWPGIQNLS